MPGTGAGAQQGVLPIHFVPPILLRHGLRDAHTRPLVGCRRHDDTIRSWRSPPQHAWSWPLLEWTRTGNSFPAIAFDVDRPIALERLAATNIGANDLPIPNLVVYRRASGNAHAFYILQRPVHRGANARPLPLAALGRISEWLRLQLLADAGFAGVLVANPLHCEYETLWFRTQAYSLRELGEHIPRGWRRPRIPTTDAGRNCAVFHSLRSWIGKPANWRVSEHEVLAIGHALNVKFPNPMDDNEVRGIATSVLRIHRCKMATGQQQRGFALIQARRGRANSTSQQRQKGIVSGQKRRVATLDRDLRIVERLKAGDNPDMVARTEGVCLRTVYYARSKVQRTTKAGSPPSGQVSEG